MQFLKCTFIFTCVLLSTCINVEMSPLDEGNQRQTLYEYYTEGGIKMGLEANGTYFTLNGKEIRIISGAIHYFRVHHELWKDRFQKMKAAGLNTIETYVAWNLHETQQGKYNFDGNLDIVKFLKTAQELDLFVIFRPGPYICSEWEFGGMPHWLLRDPNMKVRTTYPPFMQAVDNFFSELLQLVSGQQFTDGGSIIAMQIENEYGAYVIDKDYPVAVMNVMIKYGEFVYKYASSNNLEM